MKKAAKDYLKMGSEGMYHPLKSLLQIPFKQVWKGMTYLSHPGNSPDKDTTLYITQIHIYTRKYFQFKSAGIAFAGRQPLLVPYYLWISSDNINHCLDLTATPVCIPKLYNWKIEIDTDVEIIEKVEVYGYATIIKEV